MDTLLLNRDGWDLAIDAFGNIAKAGESYSILQDVASACRLFLGELYYGPPSAGIPYFAEALGRAYPTALLKARLNAAALAVPGVLTAQCFLTRVVDRSISGQMQITTAAGPQIITL